VARVRLLSEQATLAVLARSSRLTARLLRISMDEAAVWETEMPKLTPVMVQFWTVRS